MNDFPFYSTDRLHPEMNDFPFYSADRLRHIIKTVKADRLRSADAQVKKWKMNEQPEGYVVSDIIEHMEHSAGLGISVTAFILPAINIPSRSGQHVIFDNASLAGMLGTPPDWFGADLTLVFQTLDDLGFTITRDEMVGYRYLIGLKGDEKDGT